MKVQTIVEQEDGTYEFKANLTKAQHAFLLEYAIRDLMGKGLLPFAVANKPEERASIINLIPEPGDKPS